MYPRRPDPQHPAPVGRAQPFQPPRPLQPAQPPQPAQPLEPAQPRQPSAPVGRAQPPPASRIVPQVGVPPVPEPPEPARRSVGKVIGTVATTLLVLGLLGVVFKIIVRPVPTPQAGPAPVAAASNDASGEPIPAPNGSGSAAAPAPGAPPPTGTSGVAMPRGDLPGWHQTFTDDFTGNLTDQWGVYDGQPGGDPGGWFNSGHVSATGGLLTIGAWRAPSPNGNIYVSGGMSNSKVFSQTYGLYKIRFKMDRGWGVAYTLQLWPSNDHWPPEIDILEDNGRDRMMTSATLHYGSTDTHVHREVRGDWTGWHTAELEWTQGRLVYRIDGKVWATIVGSYVPSTPMSIAIQTQAWRCGGSWEGCPNGNTPTRVNLQVDWVVAYQKSS